MKKIYVFALAAVMMAACSEDVLEERVSEKNEAAAKSLLQVRTRTSDEAAIAYPVQVYVFQGDGSDEECMAVQTIGDEGQTLNIALTEGTYSVYAIGGASSTDYSLPTKEEAATTTAIALKEGKALTDLMTATATATLTDGGTNTVTLGLQRKTMLIQDVTIKKVPSAATAVSVTIAPLWQSLTVGGTYSTTGQSTTIALTKQEDNRTWKNSVSAFLLPPSSQPASVSVNITIDGTTKTYTYSTSDQLEAGYKINISGTYTEAIGVALTGTITGATWLGERTISFTFDENGNTWFAAEHIICSFNAEKHIFTTFAELDGLDDTRISEGGAIMTGNGIILFGTLDGYYEVDRQKLMASDGALLKLQITGFLLSDEWQSPRLGSKIDYYVPGSTHVRVPSEASNFGFRFAAMNYQLQHRVHYQYMLEGYDKDWRNAEKDRTATYFDVPSGTYVFKVKAFLLESPDKYDIRSIEVDVRSALPLGALFKWVVGIMLLLLIAFFVYKFNKEFKQKIEFPVEKKSGKGDDEDSYEIIDVDKLGEEEQ